MIDAQWAVGGVFAAVYVGMVLGRWPGLRLDRAGIAAVGAVAMLALGALSVEQALHALDATTLALLGAFMVVSAQLRQAGFYNRVTRAVVRQPWPQAGVLAAFMAVVAGLSAVFSNDVVCLALTPMVVQLCVQRSWPCVPWLVALACAANIGSAATLIGNPQNMLIGAVLKLPFAAYAQAATPLVALALALAWAWLVWGPGGLRRSIGKLSTPATVPGAPPPTQAHTQEQLVPPSTAKGLWVVGLTLLALCWGAWPAAVVACVAAGVLLVSRRVPSAQLLAEVDWPLLVMFAGLFVVNRALELTGLPAQAVHALREAGVALEHPPVLLSVGLLLSNLVSNVPAVMLLLPHLDAAQALQVGLTLGLVTTLAGNLLLVGSVANLIVADLARRQGITLTAWAHAKLGVPITLLTLGVVAWVVIEGF